MNLADICDNAKKGREYALLGNYDSSIVYYQGVIQQIQKHCQSLRDPALKVKWQQVSFSNAYVRIQVIKVSLNRQLGSYRRSISIYMSLFILSVVWFFNRKLFGLLLVVDALGSSSSLILPAFPGWFHDKYFLHLCKLIVLFCFLFLIHWLLSARQIALLNHYCSTTEVNTQTVVSLYFW